MRVKTKTPIAVVNYVECEEISNSDGAVQLQLLQMAVEKKVLAVG